MTRISHCKFVLTLFVLICARSFSQSYKIDTLKNAIASVNSFSLLNITGTTSSKGLYMLGYNLDNNNGNALPVEFVRVDLNKKTVQYKAFPGILSTKANFWTFVFDSSGTAYLSANNPRRTIIKLNLKDSIKIEDLGNAFSTGTTLAYSESLGRDGKIYFGGSSGGTYWSSYDPVSKKFDKHPEIDPNNDYVLSIAGDTNYVYAQTGQRNSVQLWSVRKKDEVKKMLCRINNRTRIDLRTFSDGIYVQFNSDTLSGKFKLVNGQLVKVAAWPANPISYTEVNDINLPSVSSYFDGTQNKLFFSVNHKPYENVDIKTKPIRMDIRKIFAFPNDKDNIYYVGDYYGNYYRYDLRSQTSYLLGTTGYNVYSTLALNDSIIYFGGYPSGYVMRWNRNQPWTTLKFINGKVTDAMDPIANPKILSFWKSYGDPPAGFHHTNQMLFGANKNLIGAGNVIRIGNAASIGVYDPAKNVIYGIKYEAFTGLSFSGICNWKNLVIYSMNGSSAKQPKLYYYDPSLNKMVDSIDAGFADYGSIYVKGNLLTGVANDRVYKLDLGSKKIIETHAYPKNSIQGSYMLTNGTLLVNTNQQIPQSFCTSVSLLYSNFVEANGIVYSFRGNMIVRITGLVKR